MSKTFGQLKAGDEVYVINGDNVDIVNVQSTEIVRQSMLINIVDEYYSLPLDWTSFYEEQVGNIYCDIDEAMRKMQEICANALHNYKCASGSLNLLETKQNKK
jgi:hypothetical protein